MTNNNNGINNVLIMNSKNLQISYPSIFYKHNSIPSLLGAAFKLPKNTFT